MPFFALAEGTLSVKGMLVVCVGRMDEGNVRCAILSFAS